MTMLIIKIIVLIYCYITLIDLIENDSIKIIRANCTRHDWVKKGEGEQTYLVCQSCKYLAGTDDQYEEFI